jgi:3'(2'), 5'-bisphosphate nucleotidase
MSPETEAFVEARRSRQPGLSLISAGSSLKLCRVAEGSADEYPRFAPTMEWDTAAGDAIARAAGCDVLRWKEDAPAGSVVYNKPDLHNPWFLVRRTET